MKRYYFLLFLLLFSTGGIEAQVDGKINLTQDQILNKLPENVINTLFRPISWADSENIVMVKLEDGKRCRYLYNIVTGESSKMASPTAIKNMILQIEKNVASKLVEKIKKAFANEKN